MRGLPVIGSTSVFGGPDFEPWRTQQEVLLQRARLAQDASQGKQSFMAAMAARQMEQAKLAEDKRQFDTTLAAQRSENRDARQHALAMQARDAGQKRLDTLLKPKAKKPLGARDAWLKSGLANLGAALGEFEGLDKSFQDARTRADAADKRLMQLGAAWQQRQPIDGIAATDPGYVEAYKKASDAAKAEAKAAYDDMVNFGDTRKKHRFYSGDDNDNRTARVVRELVAQGGAALPIQLRERKIDNLEAQRARAYEQAAQAIPMPAGNTDKEKAKEILVERQKWVTKQVGDIDKQIAQLEQEIETLATLDNEYFQQFARTYEE